MDCRQQYKLSSLHYSNYLYLAPAQLNPTLSQAWSLYPELDLHECQQYAIDIILSNCTSQFIIEFSSIRWYSWNFMPSFRCRFKWQKIYLTYRKTKEKCVPGDLFLAVQFKQVWQIASDPMILIYAANYILWPSPITQQFSDIKKHALTTVA